ncbi:MAG: CpsD/CapB family tyrosine-protein kinase [Clostridia bacterium]|nr:CpsD/CapB family tyrosine-protein kinase [Clostridia bacterium]
MEKSEIIVNDFPRSPVSESFRLFRTNLFYLFDNEESKTICLTSSNASEGKSWVTANLAISCAQYGKKVLIIDADLRKGRQHRIFKKSNRTGLSDLLKNLRGTVKEDEVQKIEEELTVKIQDTEINNVYLLTSGPVPFNPSELLGTANIEFLLNLLKKEFDLIIIDTPPASIITDALLFATKVDYMFIVASSRKTKKELLLSTKKAIESVGGKIPGIILNEISTERRKEYSKSYQKYVIEK